MLCNKLDNYKKTSNSYYYRYDSVTQEFIESIIDDYIQQKKQEQTEIEKLIRSNNPV